MKKKQEKQERLFYSVAETMEILGLSRSLIYGLIDKEIPTVRLGNKILIPKWFITALTGEPKKE